MVTIIVKIKEKENIKVLSGFSYRTLFQNDEVLSTIFEVDVPLDKVDSVLSELQSNKFVEYAHLPSERYFRRGRRVLLDPAKKS